MKRIASFVGVLAVSWFGAASAHQTGIDLPPGESAVAYVYSDHTPSSVAAVSVWLESNGRTTDGVYPSQTSSTPMGLQVNPVCYGTFTQADVDALNQTCTYQIFSYVPFRLGGEAECAAEATEIEDDCNACGDEECRIANSCDELCGGTDPCAIDEVYVDADDHVTGATPTYVNGNGCHSGH